MGNHTVIICSLGSTLEPGGEDGEEVASQEKERGDLQPVEYEFVCGNKHEITACQAKPLSGSWLTAYRGVMSLVPCLFSKAFGRSPFRMKRKDQKRSRFLFKETGSPLHRQRGICPSPTV